MEDVKLIRVNTQTDLADLDAGKNMLILVEETGQRYWGNESDPPTLGGQSVLSSDVNAEDDSSYFNIFTITLTASVSRIYRVYLIAESDVAGAAVCISIVASEGTTEGYAIVKTPTGASTVQTDVLAISTTENEAPVTGLLAANVAFPIEVLIAVTAGATAGTLSIQVRPEAGTGAIAYIKTNSFYE